RARGEGADGQNLGGRRLRHRCLSNGTVGGNSEDRGGSQISERMFDHGRTFLKRVDVRFGSFTSFALSRRVRFAPGADIRPMPAFMSTRPTTRPKINLLKSRRSARAGAAQLGQRARGVVSFPLRTSHGRGV